MIPTTAWEILSEIFGGESSETITKMKIGYGGTDESYSDSDLEHPYTDGGFEIVTVTPVYSEEYYTLSYSHTFTNTSGSNRIIREAGLFFDSGALAYRKCYPNCHYLNNFSVVQNGGEVTVTITITFGRSVMSTPFWEGDSTVQFYYTINITPYCVVLIAGDTLAKIKLGYGYTIVSESDGDLEHPYTDSGFEMATVTSVNDGPLRTLSHTFTNNYCDERVVREVALFSLVDEFLCRVVFQENDIQNLCLVPTGKEIDISVIMTFWSASYIGYRYSDATGNIDLTTFDHPGAICYNGIVAPNAGIDTVINALGMKTWNLNCSSQVRDDIDRLIRYAGPVTTGESITGKQYVVSAFRSGVLYIENDGTYYNVYMVKPVKENVFGENRIFQIEISESAYQECV